MKRRREFYVRLCLTKVDYLFLCNRWTAAQRESPWSLNRILNADIIQSDLFQWKLRLLPSPYTERVLLEWESKGGELGWAVMPFCPLCFITCYSRDRLHAPRMSNAEWSQLRCNLRLEEKIPKLLQPQPFYDFNVHGPVLVLFDAKILRNLSFDKLIYSREQYYIFYCSDYPRL